MQQEALSPIMARRLTRAAVNFEASAARAVQIEDDVKVVLNADDGPVPTIQYPFYLAFARQVARLMDAGLTGASLTRETDLIKATWASRGLDEGILTLIAGVV